MGLGSGGHLVGMMPALTMNSLQLSTFLGGFALGMTVSMALFMGIIGIVSRMLVQRGGSVPPAHKLSLWVSIVSIAIGVFYGITSFLNFQ